jgi:hypothetical protein
MEDRGIAGPVAREREVQLHQAGGDDDGHSRGHAVLAFGDPPGAPLAVLAAEPERRVGAGESAKEPDHGPVAWLVACFARRQGCTMICHSRN